MIKKISITYPPLESEKWTPLLSQNRQFQWFEWDPTYIFPMIPAYTATLLKSKWYEVLWDDGIAEWLSYQDWLEKILAYKPDLIMIETKTPTVKRMRAIIDELKSKIPDTKIVLVWDHITAFPEESFGHCNVDFTLKSGDYDFSLLNLVNYLNTKEELKWGWYWKEWDEIKNSGAQNLMENDLNSLPFIDRELVKWKLYAYKNWNFKYTPWTYTMVGRDCWWGRCTFCSWTTFFSGKNYRNISAQRLLDEIEQILIPLGIKEVFDDSGSLPAGDWLKEFCQWMIDRWLNKKIVFSHNMRFGALTREHYELMAKANFRYVLYGVESANQATLDKIDKNLKFEVIEQELRMIKEVNKQTWWCISPHITTMIGYPWETYEDAKNTVEFAKKMFQEWLIYTLQSTIIMPYPGTPLYKDAVKNDWLEIPDGERDRFDMRERILKSPLTPEQTKELVQWVYKSFLSPKVVINKILSVRSWDDVKFLFRAWKKLLNHLLDFKK